ncbi:uncharacterized protein PFLUO_LOCUS7553 [Penicillium psychrofluorescens]|uniref:uncharacterized protein n=1 Tax=Penicillium psychrofluorescens TaxID=3158075 RepID=UPI003CCD0BB9
MDRPLPPVPGYGFAGPNTYRDDDPAVPYHSRYSQQSLASDGGGYENSGRMADGDQYAENIPLKSATQNAHNMNPEWMERPPSPGGFYDNDRQNSRRKRGGFFSKKPAWVTWILTAAQIIVFIVELVKSAQLTGSPIETHPAFNPMIGPSPYVQIWMGSRYVPCMKNMNTVQNNVNQTLWACPNTTQAIAECSLQEICGFSGSVPNPHPGGSLSQQPAPNQWFRFIVPIFLHGGFIHIGFNLLVQLTMGADMERMIGIWRYTLTYFASGIFGFALGGNYSGYLESADGCSGCLFGILALYLLDLLYDWPNRDSRWIELLIMVLGVGVSFVLGLLPALDNFSHIGGFIMGLAIGLSIMRSPNNIRERIGLAREPYVAMSGGAGQAAPDDSKSSRSKVMDFLKGRGGVVSSGGGSESTSKNPMNFFKGRKPLWWLWWFVRAGSLVAVLVGFVLLITNFYNTYESNCTWCYRLSCLPVNGWCDQQKVASVPP